MIPADQLAEGHSVRSSIIIVNYNAREKLLRCLKSVLRSAPSDCEVIVVDNASSDGMADLIEADFSEVTLIRSKINLGFGAGNNLAASRAQGRYLLFLNPDTVVKQGWSEALLAPLDADARVGLVTSKILLADQSGRVNACGNSVHITGLTFCRGLGELQSAFAEVEEVDAVSGAAFAIRRELFETLNGFDEEAFLYMEDTDLSLRARLAGRRCLFAPDSVVLHDYALRITPLKIFWQERNRYLMLLKSLRWRTLVALLPAYLLAELIAWAFVLLKDRTNIRNKLRAYWWVVENWPDIMRKRKRTQSLRAVRDRELLKKMGFRIDFDQASAGWAGTLARFMFNPLFFALKTAYLVLIWW